MPRRIPSHRHPDLFAPKNDPPAPMGAADQTKLLRLMSALLTEALAPAAQVEARDEDHA